MNVAGTSALPLEAPVYRPRERVIPQHHPVRPRIGRPEPRPAVRPAVRPERTVQTARPAVRREKTAVRTRKEQTPPMKLSFRTSILFVSAVALLLLIVYSFMELSQLSRAGQNMSSELQQLKEEEFKLRRQAEAGVSISEAEAYAVGELGMVKPSREQIVYINMAGEDHAEIVVQTGFWGAVKQLFGSISSRIMFYIE